MNCLVLWVLLLLLAGCEQGTTAYQEGKSGESAPMAGGDSRIIVDAGLQGRLKIQTVEEDKIEGERLYIQIKLVNTSSGQASFKYKFEWFNAEGKLLEATTTVWKALSLERREKRVITAAAPNAEAKDFRLKMLGLSL